MVNDRNLRQFMSVIEHRSLKRAAEEIGITQPALTKGIQKLEEDLGTRLFDRTPRGMRPTHMGLILKDHAEDILSRMSEAVREIRLRGDLQIGEVSVGIGAAIPDSVLCKALSEFTSAYPSILIQTMTGEPQRLEELLWRQQIDFIVGNLEQAEHHEGLDVIRFPPEENLIVVRSNHPLVQMERLEVRDLIPYPSVGLQAPPKLQKQLQRLRSAGGGSPTLRVPPYLTDRFEHAFDLVEVSDFRSYGPRTLIHERVTDGRLAVLEIEDLPSIVSQNGIVLRKGYSLPHAAGALVDAFVEIAGSNEERPA